MSRSVGELFTVGSGARVAPKVSVLQKVISSDVDLGGEAVSDNVLIKPVGEVLDDIPGVVYGGVYDPEYNPEVNRDKTIVSGVSSRTRDSNLTGNVINTISQPIVENIDSSLLESVVVSKDDSVINDNTQVVDIVGTVVNGGNAGGIGVIAFIAVFVYFLIKR